MAGLKSDLRQPLLLQLEVGPRPYSGLIDLPHNVVDQIFRRLRRSEATLIRLTTSLGISIPLCIYVVLVTATNFGIRAFAGYETNAARPNNS